MRRLLLLLHLLSAAGLMGALAAQLAVAAVPADAAAAPLPGLRAAVAATSARVVLPALAAMAVSGLLLIAAQPGLLERRWVLAKALLGGVLAGLAMLPLAGAVAAARSLAQQAPLGPAELALLAQALQTEQRAAWAALLLAVLAAALAIWRPRLGQPPGD